MFDFAWSEIALVVVVALILIGPKDLPVAIRAISNLIRKARRMAGEFQTHVDDMVRDADLSEVRGTFSELRGMDFRGSIKRAIDPDGSLGAAMGAPAGYSMATPSVTDPPAYDPHGFDAAAHNEAIMVAERPRHMFAPVLDAYPDDGRPAFIPPELRDPAGRPAFIPPQVPQAHR